MKTKLLLLIICISTLSCTWTKSQKENTSQIKNGVEVLYFHAKQCCATCMAIENNTKALLDESFSKEINDSLIVFRSLEITENPEIARKHQVSFSSLIIVDIENGKEAPVNLTDYAFSKARTSPDTFKDELRATILKMLE